MHAAKQGEIVEKPDLQLVGFSVVASLNHVLATRLVGELRETLDRRRAEIPKLRGTGIYLVQIYPTDGHWTHDVPYQHVVGVQVDSLEGLPEDMISHVVPRGTYVKVIHEGPESRIAETYDWINRTYGHRPIDMELWSDIYNMEGDNSRIEVYFPIQEGGKETK